MDKQIPIYFNDVSFSSPFSPIAPNIGESKVRVFTKYANRNGSYITDEVAEQLIQSTLEGNVPVVGFFDPEKNDFTTHVQEDICSGYGYCKEFCGWESQMDNDGITREYAVFSVVLFTNYFSAANKIIGNPQSMELNVNSITGDWQTMEDGKEYYVYKTAKMKGFTVLGKSVEPCFRGAAFFSANESRLEKFSSLLVELKDKVDNLNNNQIGGEPKMIFNVSGIENEHYAMLFEKLNPNFNEENNFEVAEVVYAMDENTAYTFACGGKKQKKYTYSIDEEGALNYELAEEFGYDEELVANYSTLQESYNGIMADYDLAKNNIEELNTKIAEYEVNAAVYAEEKTNFEAAIAEYENTVTSLNEKIAEYENTMNAIEEEKKNKLIDSYENYISEEEINNIRGKVKDFSLEEVEQNLALTFARNSISSQSNMRVANAPAVEEESDFAKLMKNYKK